MNQSQYSVKTLQQNRWAQCAVAFLLLMFFVCVAWFVWPRLSNALFAQTPCDQPSKLSGNAGCLIVHNGVFLSPKHKATQRWNLPGGTSERGESAQCTAKRETWEEVGVRVNVGDLITQFDNGFYLFACTPVSLQYARHYPVPESGKDEVSDIQWLKPQQLKDKDWRFPKRWQHQQAVIQAAIDL